jgi:hypothetical protein
MKSIITTKLFLGICLISSLGFTSINVKKESAEPKECLQVIGIAIGENNEPIDGVEVRLLKKNEEMEWVNVTNVPYHDHNFEFILEANEYYTIEVSKPGFVKRSVVISTQLPANVSVKPLFRYEFDVTLFKEKKGMDDYYLDFPVALVGYSKKDAVFENSPSYTKHIKAKIKAESDHAMVESMMNGK